MIKNTLSVVIPADGSEPQLCAFKSQFFVPQLFGYIILFCITNIHQSFLIFTKNFIVQIPLLLVSAFCFALTIFFMKNYPFKKSKKFKAQPPYDRRDILNAAERGEKVVCKPIS